jgi:hypothetical protein
MECISEDSDGVSVVASKELDGHEGSRDNWNFYKFLDNDFILSFHYLYTTK